MEPAVRISHRHAPLLPRGHRVDREPLNFGMVAHVDPGAGDRLAVGVEHPAANRERAVRVGGVRFRLREAISAVGRTAGAGGAVASFGASSPSETRAADAPQAIRPAASRVADANLSFWSNMILSTS